MIQFLINFKPSNKKSPSMDLGKEKHIWQSNKTWEHVPFPLHHSSYVGP